MRLRRDTGLILALDVLDRTKALGLANELGEYVDAIKVGYPLVLKCGLDIVREVVECAAVICDFKVADVPHVDKLIVRQAIEHNAIGVIAQGFIGSDAIRACVEAAGDALVFVVVEMSHPGAEDFFQEQCERIAKLAVEAKAHGVIAPGTRPERIRLIKDIVGELLVLCPGIGVQGGGARAAIEAGADYLIVGRSIYDAAEPKEVARTLAAEIEAARRE